jgi:GntR family transcriptional regulator
VLSLRISANSGVPVYLQLEQQIKQSIASGLLQAGDQLPSTRRLAVELRINPNTVMRAFQNLEREGVIRTVPGGGTFVGEWEAAGQGLLKSEKLRRLRPLADQLAIEAAQLRVSRYDVGKLLNQSLDALETSVTRNRKQKGDTQTPASRSIAEKTS